MSQESPLKHLGIIADGNRRWARQNGLPIVEGHRKGISRIRELVSAAAEAQISYLTFYVFSTENWNRSADEVKNIMKLAETYIPKYAKELRDQNTKLLILGSSDHVSPKLAQKLKAAEDLTRDCTGMTVCFCFNYGGEQEIADAAKEVAKAKLDFTPENIRAHVYHPEVPNLDLVVRTSGEQRISGFMLLRSAYAEFLFLDKFFPEMTAADIPEIVENYMNRERRFGK